MATGLPEIVWARPSRMHSLMVELAGVRLVPFQKVSHHADRQIRPARNPEAPSFIADCLGLPRRMGMTSPECSVPIVSEFLCIERAAALWTFVSNACVQVIAAVFAYQTVFADNIIAESQIAPMRNDNDRHNPSKARGKHCRLGATRNRFQPTEPFGRKNIPYDR